MVLPHEMGLIAYVGVEEQVVRVLHDDVPQPGAGGDVVVVLEVETGVDGGDVDDAVEVFVAFVGGKGQVLAAAEQDEGVAFSQQVGNNLRHGIVGVGSGLPQNDVAQVGDMCIAVGDCQLVEITPYLVGSTAASGIVFGPAVLANTEQHEAVFRNLIARMIGDDARTQCNGELAGVVPQRVGLYR